MRSNLTVEEWEAAAMLLGEQWTYDPYDHTFVDYTMSGDLTGYFDADSMRPIYTPTFNSTEWEARKNAVYDGELGASDAANLVRVHEK